MNKIIRTEFVLHYSTRSKEDSAKGWALIKLRDQKTKALNRSYGFSKSDGTVPTVRMSYIDIEYKNKYDHIEQEFNAQYESITPSRLAWMRENRISLFEYLLIDNCGQDTLDYLADKAAPQNRLFFDAITYKADFFVNDWKTEYTIGGIQSCIQKELLTHGYARSRCRKFFNLRPWDISKNLTIINYSIQWRSALRQSLQSLTAL